MLRFQLVYRVLVPAIVVASGVLVYYAWQTARQFARLGERTILESTSVLVADKVRQVDDGIIATANAVLGTVDLDAAEDLEGRWPPVPASVLGSVSDLVVLDEDGNVVAHAGAGTPARQREFRKVLLELILPDLELHRRTPGQLRNLHRTYSGRSYLLSYQAAVHEGRRAYLIVHHDTEQIRAQFETLFAAEEGKALYNVVDNQNQRVFGPSLAGAGDYLVAARFPTTLYGWRLQVAPKQAPLLESAGRSRRLNEVTLAGTSFLVVLLGVAFVLWAAAKERRVNALKAEFVANVSHELKTPLSVIRMFAEMLATDRVRSDDKRAEYLSIICRESERLSALVENVLDFAALEQGRRTYRLARADLPAAVRSAVDAFASRTGGVRVELEVPTAPIPQVRLDEQAVALAVMNLLDNAAKYAAGSPIRVQVEATARDVRVHVRDQGPGIPGEDLRRVFDRFYRSRTASNVRGSGIGLSLVKHIAEAHGGRAWAETPPDGGARVSFSVPFPAGARDEARPHAPAAAHDPPAPLAR